MEQPLLFLIKLAWECRYRLPILITIGFMALDIRMQLEIHVQMRRIRRRAADPLRNNERENDDEQNLRDSDDSSGSWMTIDNDEFSFDDDEDDDDDDDDDNVDNNSTANSRVEVVVSPNRSHVYANLLNVNLEN